MITCERNTTEAALHVLLAATYLAHQPSTPSAVVAVLAYLGLAALRLAEEDSEQEGEE